jgi:hypothetical protein
MHNQLITANPALGIRVFSRKFLRSSGQQLVLIGFCQLRKMLRDTNITSVKKMTEKAFLIGFVV